MEKKKYKQTLQIEFRDDSCILETIQCDNHYIDDDDFLYIQVYSEEAPALIASENTIRMINSAVIRDIKITYHDEEE